MFCNKLCCNIPICFVTVNFHIYVTYSFTLYISNSRSKYSVFVLMYAYRLSVHFSLVSYGSV
jgi:hypothetical protein